MTTYLYIYLGSLVLALLVTPVVIWAARRIGAVDRPDIRTVHKLPMPRIGGVAIFLSAMALIVLVIFVNNNIGQAFRAVRLQLVTLLGSATLIFTVGLVDDLKGLQARVKLMVELLVALVLCLVGVRISDIALTDQWVLHLGGWGYVLTVLWVTGITNAVNLSDGLDGLAAGISAVACCVIAVFAIHGGNVVMAVLMLAMLGSLTGFLFFNFSPAKIFMGDCGSLFLGFTIASASVMCMTKSAALVGLALPALALGIPIFDTLFSMFRRFLERRSIFSADRRHFHHRLIDMGMKQHHVVIIIYVMTLFSAGLGMFMMVTRDISSLMIFFCILLLLLLAFRAVSSVRLRDTIAALQQKYATTKQVQEEIRDFEDAQLHFRNAYTYDQWWSAVCKAAQRMDFAWVSLKTRDKDGTVRTEVWRTAGAPPNLSDVVTMTFPLRNHGRAGAMEFEIAISVNGSFESAGHRATLFGRLIDEHEVASKV